METVVKTRGVVGAERHIVADEMPFAEGEEVEIVVWSRHVSAKAKMGGIADDFAELAEWTRQKYPNAKPLSDEALSRKSIYED